jgi:uncharacterized repeat protein (TIGR01451 family)
MEIAAMKSPTINIHKHFRSVYYINLIAAVLMTISALPVRASGGLYSGVTTIPASCPLCGFGSGNGSTNTVALSSDGKTAVIASKGQIVGGGTGTGAVYIYGYTAGSWSLQQEIDDPDMVMNPDQFGSAIALSSDGQSILIGSSAKVNDQDSSGKAYLYTLSNGSWIESHEFDDPGAHSLDFFGSSGVALSGDGKIAVIGAYGVCIMTSCSAGEAYIYSDSNGTWTQSAAIPDPDSTGGDYFGGGVAISADGSTVLIGSSSTVNGQGDAGKAYLYTVNNGMWNGAHEFDDPAAASDDFFGTGEVALSGNGQTAVIGAYGTTLNGITAAGEGYIFTESNGTWTQTAAIQDPDTSGDFFGHGVAVSEDGSTVLIGSDAVSMVGGQPTAGKAYLYTLNNGIITYTHEFDSLTAGYYYFGYAGVALAGDGETALIVDENNAYFYQSPDDLSLTLMANPINLATGQSVSLDATISNNDTVVIANNVVFTGTLPAGMSYSSSDAAGGNCSASGQTVTCTLASLAPSTVWQPTITGSASAAGSLIADASVVSNEPDPNSSNNTSSTTVKVTAPSSGGSSGGGGGTLGVLSLLILGLLLLGKHR